MATAPCEVCSGPGPLARDHDDNEVCRSCYAEAYDVHPDAIDRFRIAFLPGVRWATY